MQNKNNFTKQVQSHTNNVSPSDDVGIAVDAVEPVFFSFHNITQLIAFKTLTLKLANAPRLNITATKYFDQRH